VRAVAPPSISSVSYGDHDSLLRTPRRVGEAGCPLKRSVSTCDHRMTRAVLHTSDRTQRVSLLLPQHPIHPYRQLACHHHLRQRPSSSKSRMCFASPWSVFCCRTTSRRICAASPIHNSWPCSVNIPSNHCELPIARDLRNVWQLPILEIVRQDEFGLRLISGGLECWMKVSGRKSRWRAST
jgi:hypothetical protein